MLVQEKTQIGIYADGENIKSLYKLMKYDLEFHIFGEDINYIEQCIKYILQYKRTIILHYDVLKIPQELIQWFNNNGVIISLDNHTNLTTYDIIHTIPKYKRLIINIHDDFSIKIINKIIYYYYGYNRYHCGVNIDVSNMKGVETFTKELNTYFNKRTTGYDDIYETAIHKYKVVSINDFILPYRDLYFSIKKDCIIFGGREYHNLNVDFGEFYKSLYNTDKCKDCIVVSHCGKYKTNCNSSKTFYGVIIQLLLDKVERIK